jgi:hypothetical protein
MGNIHEKRHDGDGYRKSGSEIRRISRNTKRLKYPAGRQSGMMDDLPFKP